MRLAFIIAIFGVIYGAVTDRANSISQIAEKSERRRNRKYCKVKKLQNSLTLCKIYDIDNKYILKIQPSMSASRRKRRRCPPPIHSDSTKPEIDPEKLRPISSKKAKVVSGKLECRIFWKFNSHASGIRYKVRFRLVSMIFCHILIFSAKLA